MRGLGSNGYPVALLPPVAPLPPIAPTVTLPTFDSSDAGAMTSNLVIQSPEDQFLHWRQDMEEKQEEQLRQMREL